MNGNSRKPLYNTKNRNISLILLTFLCAVCAAFGVYFIMHALPSSESAHADTVHTHDGTWTDLSQSDIASYYDSSSGKIVLTEGSYYLDGDIDLRDVGYDIQIQTGATVELCLNGHVLTGTGTSSVIYMTNSRSSSAPNTVFTLSDCREGEVSNTVGEETYTSGVITGGIGYDSGDYRNTRYGGAIFVEANGSISSLKNYFYMTGGVIAGNTANNGAMAIEAYFYMTGGEVLDNDCDGIYVTEGRAEISNVRIAGNNSHGISSRGTHNGLTLTGLEITNNAGYGVYVGRSCTVDSCNISGNTLGGVYLGWGRTFTLNDGTTISGNGGAGIYNDLGEADININGGLIEGNQGGGITVSRASYLTITGGTIRNNSTDGNGGGVVLGVNAYFTMTGGTITGNTASGDGGGVYIDEDAFTDISGGTITGNTADGNGGGVYVVTFTYQLPYINLSGNPVITDNYTAAGGSAASNLYIAADAILSITAALNGANVGVTMENQTGVFTSGLSTYNSGDDPADYFFSDMGYVVVESSDGEAELLAYEATVDFAGGKTYYAATVEAAFEYAADLATSAGNEATITLLADATTEATLTVDAGDYIILDLAGYTITYAGGGDASVITVYGTFTLTDSSDTGSGGTGALTGGTGTNISGSLHGGGVYVSGSDAVFTMESGTISSDNRLSYGGGVYVNGGAFYMNGGTISDHTAGMGGGVYIDGGTFEMNGGYITENTTTGHGGGVYVESGTFEMNGGNITDNEIQAGSYSAYGGGVFIEGTFTMTSGTISGNEVSSSNTGGGVYIEGTFTMTGGTITNNTVRSYSVSVLGDFTMTGGEISNASVSLLQVSSGTFIMKDGTLSGALATSSVGVAAEVFIMCGGTITDCVGSNVVQASTSFTMYGGEITGNNVTDVIYITSSSSAFYMRGGTISGNTASRGIISIIVRDGTAELTGGTIKDNTSGRGDIYISTGAIVSISGDLYFSGTIRYSDSSFTVTGGYFDEDTKEVLESYVGDGYGFVDLAGGAGYGDDNYDPDFPWAVYEYVSGDDYTAEIENIPSGGTPELTVTGPGGTPVEDYTIIYDGEEISEDRLPNDPGEHTVTVKTGGFINGADKVYSDGFEKEVTYTVYVATVEQDGEVYYAADMDDATAHLASLSPSESPATITLYDDVTMGLPFVVMYYVILDLAGYTIAYDNVRQPVAIFVASGTFMLKDDVGTGAINNGLVFVAYDGTFNMTGGTITGNNVSNGGGVYVREGTFKMTGGTISGNKAQYGGGVYVESGTFIMEGGTISDNEAVNGGGVYVWGTFTMSAGIISGNTASSAGDSIFIYSATGTISGGYIAGALSGNGSSLSILGGYFDEDAYNSVNTISIGVYAWVNLGDDPTSHYGDTDWREGYDYTVYVSLDIGFSASGNSVSPGTTYGEQLDIEFNHNGGLTPYQYVIDGETYNNISEFPANAGTYTVTVYYRALINGSNKTVYEAREFEFKYTVNPASITITWTGSDFTYTYNGSAQAPDYQVSGLVNGDEENILGITTVISGTNVTNGEAINAGSYEITISISNTNYTIASGASQAFVINPASGSGGNLPDGVNVSGVGSSYEYTGSQITPVPVVSGTTGNLTVNVDYTVSYGANVNVADGGSVTITFQGNYSGSYVINFTITAVEISLEWDYNGPYTYDGSEQVPEVTNATGLVGGESLSDLNISYSGDTNVSAAGSYTITAEISNGNYVIVDGSDEQAFVINPASGSGGNLPDGVSVSGVDSEYEYTGSAIEPVPVVSGTTGNLTVNVDYTVSYGANVNVADGGSVTITFQGNYSGSYVINFTITAVEISLEWDYNGPYTYDGSEQVPEVTNATGLVGGESLSDLNISYSGDTNVSAAGSYTITAEISNGNYVIVDGSDEQAFVINPATPADTVEIVLDYDTTVYDGTEKQPGVTVTVNGTVLTSDQYDVVYSNNINVGTATVTISLKNGYEGTYAEQFAITAKQLTEDMFTVTGEYTYNGSEQEATYEYSDADGHLTATDFTVSYENNIAAGTATIIFTATAGGNYCGEVRLTFDIAKAQAVIPEISDGWNGEVEEGEEVGTITPPDGWEWANPDEIPEAGEDGKASVEVVTEVDDDNYDWTGVPGYNAEDGTFTTEIEITVTPADGDDTGSDSTFITWIIILLGLLIIGEQITIILMKKRRSE